MLFSNKKTKRVHVIQIDSGQSIEESLKNKVNAFTLTQIEKFSQDLMPSSYTTGWENKEEEERQAEGQRLYDECRKTGIYQTNYIEMIVDLPLFIKLFPEIRFSYKKSVLINT